MPLLAREPFVHPEGLFSPSSARDGYEWVVLHTRPRAEKMLTRKLLQRDLPFFLPLYKRQWRNRGRLLSSYLPLFPSYVFLHADDEARRQALATNLVVGLLKVSDQKQMGEDLRRVYQLVETNLTLTPE